MNCGAWFLRGQQGNVPMMLPNFISILTSQNLEPPKVPTRILCMTAAFRTLGFVIFCHSSFRQNEYSQRAPTVKSHKCDYGSMKLMEWSAASTRQ
jgi:hypothetical protein